MPYQPPTPVHQAEPEPNRAELEPVEVVNAELLPSTGPGAMVEVDPVTVAVLAALDEEAKERRRQDRPKKTTDGYERDWTLWGEFHRWLARTRTGHLLPLTEITEGTLVAFVYWLDEERMAAPSTIDRRITGVTVEGRRRGAVVTKEATLAARQALKPFMLDPKRLARGRGQAPAVTPEQIRAMNTAQRTKPAGSKAKHRSEHTIPELTWLRDRSLNTMPFGVAGRSAEVSALDEEHIVLVAGGLMVHVPSVKGQEARDVPVAYGEYPDSCPVRCYLAFQQAKHAAGCVGGAAYPHIDRYGNPRPGTRLSPEGVSDAQARAAQQAGLPIHVTCHSHRAGFLTAGRKAGKRPEELRAVSGHSDKSPVFWRYIRQGEAWENPATKGIGL